MALAQAETLDRWNALLDRVRARVPFYRDRLPGRPLGSLDQVSANERVVEVYLGR